MNERQHRRSWQAKTTAGRLGSASGLELCQLHCVESEGSKAADGCCLAIQGEQQRRLECGYDADERTRVVIEIAVGRGNPRTAALRISRAYSARWQTSDELVRADMGTYQRLQGKKTGYSVDRNSIELLATTCRAILPTSQAAMVAQTGKTGNGSPRIGPMFPASRGNKRKTAQRFAMIAPHIGAVRHHLPFQLPRMSGTFLDLPYGSMPQ